MKRSPPHRLVVVVLVAAFVVLIATVSVLTVVVRRSESCARTPVQHADGEVGVSFAEVRSTVADHYATEPTWVTVESRPTGGVAELLVRDVGGGTRLAGVRVQRDSAGFGWLVMTANTCD